VYQYRAYGLGVHSEFALPEMTEMPSSGDVRVGRASFDRTQPEGAYRGQTFWALGDVTCIEIDEVGAFLVREGREILVDPDKAAEESALRLQILGPCLAVILHQRGFLMLHASVVAIEGGAVGFLGGPHWGKSTTAAAFHARGHSLIADDVLAIDPHGEGSPLVQPGFPQMKLWPDAADSLGEALEALPRLHPKLDKRAHRIQERFQEGSVPLKRLYVLDRGDRHAILPLSLQEGLVELIRHSYTVRLLEATGTRERHFHQCSGLVKKVPVNRLQRSMDLNSLAELVALVEADLAASRH
jgi:hypothetical protein